MLTSEDQIVIALRRISQAIDTWSRHLLDVYDLTSPQLATLREIMTAETISTGSLATALHTSQPTVTGILTRLEQRGLIVRERSQDDRRIVLATVTREGRELASKAPLLLRHRFCQELQNLPRDEQQGILLTLKRVAEMMQAQEASEMPHLYTG